MDELLKLLFGQAGTPVRRDLKLHSTRDTEGNPSVEPIGGEAFLLSPEGSIDRVQVSQDLFYGGCGCTTQAPVGGQCSACGRISCAGCFTRCSLCLKSLCLVCVTRISTRDGEKDLCNVCEDEVRWKSLANKVTLGLIPPARF